MKSEDSGASRRYVVRNRAVKAAGTAATNLVGRRGDDAIIDVTMLGASGVGKTTLLASMYDQFTTVVGMTDLAITASDPATSAKMQEYLNDLHAVKDQIKVKGGIAGTQEIREYRFGVGRRGRRPLFTLRFTDYPGNYLTKPDLAGARDIELLDRALTRADVVLIAIDTPALIEENGKYNSIINTRSVISDSVYRMLQEDTQRLIILVPLKCERYLGEDNGAVNLTNRIKEEYSTLLNWLKRSEVSSKVACVIAPVQTIGSVVFSRVEEGAGEQPIFTFRTKVYGARYSPVDTEQPLRYALKFVVAKYRSTAQRGLVRVVLQRIMGTETALTTAVQEFSAGCKEDKGFEVIQRDTFLQ
jgi:GTPase SAR1 family protein